MQTVNNSRPTNPRPSRYASAGRLVKIAIGALLVVFLFVWDDHGSKAIRLLAGTNFVHVLMLLGLSLFMNWISALKWFLLLRARGVDVGLSRLMVLYLIGKFFNNFLPGIAGGDVARTVLLGGDLGSHTQAAASIFLERFTGLLSLLALSGCVLVVQPSVQFHPIINLFVLSAWVFCITAIALIYLPHIQARASRLVSLIPGLRRITPTLDRVYVEVSFIKSNHRVLVWTLLLSVLFYAAASLSLFIACLAISLEPRYLDIFLTTPIVYLVTLIPVSPNNIGWWEWSVGILLQPAGLLIAQGLAVGLLMRAVSLGVSLSGGIFLAAQKCRSD